MLSRLVRPLAHEVLEHRQMLHGDGAGAGEPVADFSLQDVNPTSSTFGQDVSLSQFPGTTASYFFRST